MDIKADLFVGGFKVVDDFLAEHVGIGDVLGLFEAFVAEQKMSRLALSRLKSSSA